MSATLFGNPRTECLNCPQYKALGNSMAVPVIAWILQRMTVSMESAA